MLAVLALLTHGCTDGSLFEDCEEYIQCIADLPSCTKLIISGADASSRVSSSHQTFPPPQGLNVLGTIPSAIGHLTALTELVIGTYGVSGTIPETIGLLTMLKVLELSSAPVDPGPSGRLSGTLPSSLRKLTRLEALLVYQTQIIGTLPSWLGELTAMKSMGLHTNFFTGVIPESIFELTSLKDLRLNSNELSGTLSENVGELTALLYLALNSNQLSGTLPETIVELTAVTGLRLQNNQISGTLSENISALTDLTNLLLENNRLSGTIPVTFAELTLLNWLHLQNNSFTAVGDGICAIQDNLVQGCDLSDNEIPGVFYEKGGPMNCPVCLNYGNCNKHNQGQSGDQPIFPNKACDFTRSSCACWATSPIPAPTSTPTKSHAARRWEQFETSLCFFEFTNSQLKWPKEVCGEVMLIVIVVLIGTVLALTCIVVYKSIVTSRHAHRESKQHGIAYTEALGHALLYQCCWCYTQSGREKALGHASAASADTVAMQTDSAREVPFLLDDAVQGYEEGVAIYTPMWRWRIRGATVQSDPREVPPL